MASQALVGVYAIVFVKKKHLPFLHDVDVTSTAVGMLGMGNKGAVAVRLRLHDSTFCFICSHLAAHRDKVDARNKDFASIMERTAFSGEGESLTEGEGGAGGRPARQLTTSRPIPISEHEFIVWLGDLNYRVDSVVSVETAMSLAKESKKSPGALESLYRHDQLRRERAEGRVFQGFEEGEIRFPPTYKFIPGTDRFDDRPDKKMRAPAWCDRILWRVTRDPRHLQALFYGSCQQMVASDHKPVMTLFDAAVRTTVVARRQEVYLSILKQLDEMENLMRPKVELTPSDGLLDVGPVSVGVAVQKTVTLKNVSPVAAGFRFVPKPEERVLFPPWLHVAPAFGLLPPGESVSIDVTVAVGPAVARDLALGRPTLSDILILRIEKGRDFFLSISGKAMPSCFGCTPSQLAGRIEPMHSIAAPGIPVSSIIASAGSAGGAAGGSSAASGEATVQLAAGSSAGESAPAKPNAGGRAGELMKLPKEVWRLVDALAAAPGGVGL